MSRAAVAPAVSSGKSKKLLEQMRDVLRVKHYSSRTERSYCDWVKRFVRFHNLRHPRETGAAEVGQKFTATVKMNVASLEPGLSQYVVKSTFLYLNPTSGPRRMSKLLPNALVRSITIPARNQVTGA